MLILKLKPIIQLNHLQGYNLHQIAYIKIKEKKNWSKIIQKFIKNGVVHHKTFTYLPTQYKLIL